jgi:serine/threonine-protein kinase
MGVVYEVEHAHTGERLALKLLRGDREHDARMLERFRREARAFAWVKSEHVVRITDAGVAEDFDGSPYLVMELLSGADLRTLLAKHGAQRPWDVVDWLGQAARGLERAHALGIVHRDLKPANLFLAQRADAPPIVKILDFGVAKLVHGLDSPEQTQSGVMVGTPAYMAPEQARGDSSLVGPAADLWSVGMIAFALLKGTRYWDGDTTGAVLAQILCEPVIAPSKRGLDLGAELDAWFLRSCCRDPVERFGSATEQARALARALVSRDAATHGAQPGASDLELGETLPLAMSDATSGQGSARIGLGNARLQEAREPLAETLTSPSAAAAARVSPAARADEHAGIDESHAAVATGVSEESAARTGVPHERSASEAAQPIAPAPLEASPRRRGIARTAVPALGVSLIVVALLSVLRLRPERTSAPGAAPAGPSQPIASAPLPPVSEAPVSAARSPAASARASSSAVAPAPGTGPLSFTAPAGPARKRSNAGASAPAASVPSAQSPTPSHPPPPSPYSDRE